MARTDPQVNIRLPISLKEDLERAAHAAGRSFTAEVIDRLVRSFPSVESFMLQNRMNEVAMVKKANADLGSRSEELRSQLSRIDLSKEATEALRHEYQVTHDRIRGLNELMGKMLGEIEAIRTQAELHAGWASDKPKVKKKP